MPRPPAPVPGVAVNVLFRSATVTIQDWCCRGADRDAEETAQGYVVAVTRRGAYLRQTGRDRVFADSGTAVFFEPGQTYRVSHPVQGGDVCTLFVLPPDGVRQLVGRYVAQATPSFRASHAAIDCRAFLLHRLARDAANAGEDPLLVEEAALGFVDRALQAAHPRGGAEAARVAPLRTAREYTERVRAIVARRFRERLSLVEIARDAACSMFHLSRLFRSVTGMSIHRHLVRTRVRYALERMLESRARLSLIALEAGFASHSHFTDTFRREVGFPPTAARSVVRHKAAWNVTRASRW